MDGTTPMTALELLEQMDGSSASDPEMMQEVCDSSSSTADLNHDAPMQDVVSGLSTIQLEQWIKKTAEQFEVADDGIGKMLVAQLALVQNKLRRLLDRQDVVETASLLSPWTTAITRLMAEFRRGYFALGKLQEMRAKKRRVRTNRYPLWQKRETPRNRMQVGVLKGYWNENHKISYFPDCSCLHGGLQQDWHRRRRYSVSCDAAPDLA